MFFNRKESEQMFAMSLTIWAFIAAGLTMGMGLVFRKKPQIVQSVIMFVAFYFIAWLMLPALSIDMVETWLMFIFAAVLAAGMTIISSGGESWKPIGIPIVSLFFLLLSSCASSGLFNAVNKAAVLDITNHGEKNTTMELASQEQAIRVTQGLALKRAAELIGSSKTESLASIAKYGRMYGNVTNEGKAVWVAPLQPNGFWRWVSSPTTPGYFIGSHVNNMDSRLVEDKPISYGTSGFYFSKDLARHLYMNGYVNYSYGTKFFQIDDNGDPYYVVPMMRPQVLLGSYFPEKWAVVNASSGDIQEFDNAEDLPDWVDRAYPQEILYKRLADWGCLSQGWQRCYFTGINVIDPTPSTIITMSSNDEMVYFTGTQFNKNKVEGATSGIVMMNARTGKADYYRRAGVTEVEAQRVMNGMVSNYEGWSTEEPVLVLVNGLETYFSVVTDGSGARKGYALLSQRNRDVVGFGKSLPDAMSAYGAKVRENKNLLAFDGDTQVDAELFFGNVMKIESVHNGQGTSFYLRINTVEDKVFVVNGGNHMAEVAVTLPGERVKISAYNTEPALIFVDEFDNMDLRLSDSPLQGKMDEVSDSVRESNEDETNRRNLETQIDELDPSQVREILRSMEDQ